ncbi:uncharacterized protein LOC115624253 [Scaptodrosophila lebanonensis]|uniref:Uncharacterized protein LOC115624253 n=1 Tax=Drosophila lebanonensis TaxID=7225 RepID=A0A6J2THZ3_DROLE|nr:uncharacterized protein LOC115624253 [Scaptodrosophila lebanonensis]
MATAESKSFEKDLRNGSEFVVLTELVRQHYLRYLKRQLEENVSAWAEQSRNHHKPTAWASIAASLEKMEARAVKACMAAQVYQRVMIKTIAAVRRNTQECRLADALFDNMQQQQLSTQVHTIVNSAQILSPQSFVDKYTQTEDNETETETQQSFVNTELSLMQKIDLFQKRLQLDEHQPKGRSNNLKTISPTATPLSVRRDEDAVARELAELFCDEPSDLNEIFGIEPTAATDDPQVCAILREIEESELPSATTTAMAEELSDPEISPTAVIIPANANKTETDLRHSRWPCELYAQRRKLNTCLVRLLDADWRREDVLRYKFHQLFGEDSDDDFSTEVSSPSIDLVDKVLLASCIFRIRPWVVRHLMRPMEEGLIGNRYLFKKLAKTLAEHIVLANPYASEWQIKQAIEYLFCIKSGGVQSAQDLEELPQISVERLE